MRHKFLLVAKQCARNLLASVQVVNVLVVAAASAKHSGQVSQTSGVTIVLVIGLSDLSCKSQIQSIAVPTLARSS